MFILLGLVSGALLSAAYRLPGCWPLSFVALIPLLHVVFHAKRKRDIFLAGTATGLCIMGTATLWFFNVLPLPAAFDASSPWLAFGFVGISWGLVTLVTGVVVGVWALAARATLSLNLPKILSMIALAVSWEVAEYGRMLSFNILTFDFTVHNPLFFSAGFIAYPLMDSESWRQFAAFGGIAFLGFLIALVNVLIYRSVQLKNRKHRAVTGALIAFVLVVVSVTPIISIREHFQSWLYVSKANQNRSITVAIISARTPESAPGLDISPYQKQIASYVSSSTQNGAELVLLPEDTQLLYPFSIMQPSQILGTSSSAVVIDSGPLPVYEDYQFLSGVPIRALTDRYNGVAVVRDKMVFAPQGEYLPFLFREMLAPIGAAKEKLNFDHARTFTQGDAGAAAVVRQGINPIKASLMFCLEVMTPDFGKHLVEQQGSQMLIVPSSDVWFHHASALVQDTLRWNQAQAVTAGVPLVQSTNQAPSFILDKYGRVLTKIGDGDEPAFAVWKLSL